MNGNGNRLGINLEPVTPVRNFMQQACLTAGRDAWSSVDIEDPNPLTLASVLRYQKKALA